MVRYAKPDPDLFVEAARRLGTATAAGPMSIGDSIWDMYAAARCGALGIGLLSGGYGKDELERAGAMRVFDDPADMLDHLDELAPEPGLGQQPDDARSPRISASCAASGTRTPAASEYFRNMPISS